MQTLSFASGPVAFAAGLLISSYVLGRGLSWRLRYDSVWEEVGISAALGLGAIAYLVFLLGMLGVLHPLATLLAVAFLLVLCYRVWLDLVGRVRASAGQSAGNRKIVLTVAAIAVAALIPGLLLTLFPATGDAHDSISYHLPLARTYAEAHQIVFTPYLRYPSSPQANQMLFTLALLFTSDVGARLAEFLMMIITAVLLYAWGVRTCSSFTGLWAALLLLATPMVVNLGSSAYIDIGVTMFAAAGAYAMFRWLSGRDTSWLVLAAVFSGFAAGSKFSALFFVVAFGAVTLYVGARDRRVSAAGMFLGTALLVAAPWYLRSLYYTGDPFFPALGSVFGYTLWTPADVQAQIHDWRVRGLTGSNLSQSDLIKLAFPALALLPLTLYYGLRHPRIRVVLAVVLAYAIFWATGASLPRYLLPVWPLVCLAAAASLEIFLRDASVVRNLRRPVAAALLAFALLVPGWLYAAASVYRRLPLPTNEQQRDVYLAERLDSYPIYQYLNEERGSDYTVYVLYDGRMRYYADGAFLGDYFGPARYSDVIDAMTTGDQLFRKLRSLGAGYFLVHSRYPVTLPTDESFDAHFTPVFVAPAGVLYRLQEAPTPPAGIQSDPA